jgi:DNA-binding Lrp family transcriptional regulator
MLDELDVQIIARLCGDIGEGAEPYQIIAAELEIAEALLLERVRDYRRRGILRRFGAILRHQAAGFSANGMTVWNVAEDEVERVGQLMAAYPEVSHCYERPRIQDWPYNLYAMVHARSEAECRAIATRLAEETGITDYQILASVREFKKSSMQYRPTATTERAARPV